MAYRAPPDVDDDNIEARDALLTAIAALQEERQRHDALEAGREKARSQNRELSNKVAEAEAELKRTKDAENSHIAYSFISGSYDAASPVSTAQAALDTLQCDYAQTEHIEAALDNEIASVSHRLDRAQDAVYAALAALVVNSAEFEQLFAEQTKAWARLRGIRKAFALIQRELHGYLPQQLADKWQAVVSLDPEAKYVHNGEGLVAIPTDETPAQMWHEALSNLLIDPDAELPAQV
jgi:hypothetical protein